MTATSTSHPISVSASGPLVTIAIPTFNRASWLSDCILLALSQTYQHFEILVSDNASTDETAEVLRRFSDRRLRVVRQKENIGLLKNWNACLAEAKGEYIVFVSDDDRIAPWMLERCMALAGNASQIPIIIALNDAYLTAQDLRAPAIVSRKLGTGIWNGADILLEYLERRISVQMCTILIRTETLRARGGFPLDLPQSADTVTWGAILLKGNAGLVNESCGTYYIHSTSQTSQLAINCLLEDTAKLMDRMTELADCSVNDAQKRREIKLQIKRYCLLHITDHLVAYCNRSTNYKEVLPVVWRWRRELICAGTGSISRLLRPLAVLLLPSPVTRWIRWGKRMWFGSQKNTSVSV